jgi:DNA mismatch endonuclease, patch repair protein
MTDVFSTEQRSRIMGRIRSRGNESTELRFMRILRRAKIIGWRRGAPLPGKPDFAFMKERLAVFVDGDFWHGNPKRFRVPKSNSAYWTQKIAGNRRRDRAANRALRRAGWQVVRFWESSLRQEDRIVARLATLLSRRSARRTERQPGRRRQKRRG